MALSDKQPNFSERGENTPPTIPTPATPPTITTTTSSMSFADALRQTPPPHQQTVTDFSQLVPTNVLISRIWRTARSSHALLFDITALPTTLTHQWFMKTIRAQSPVVYSVMYKKYQQQRYLEVYAKKRVPNDLMEKGLVFPSGKDIYKVLPCKSLIDDSTIVRLSLSCLPLEEEDELLPGIHNSLSRYGHVHHIELFKDPTSGFFMGTGYAILNLPMTADMTQSIPLTHKITYEDSGDSFHAVWANMDSWCCYCHADGHTKYDCEESRKATKCHSCQRIWTPGGRLSKEN